MTLGPITEVIADRPIDAGVTVHMRGSNGKPPCISEDAASASTWTGRQGILAVSLGAKLCRKKACFGAGAKGGT